MLCVSARLGVVALLELQRPEQREQLRLQWPVRPHLCGGGGAIKAPDGGGYGECAASAAREQAHRHQRMQV